MLEGGFKIVSYWTKFATGCIAKKPIQYITYGLDPNFVLLYPFSSERFDKDLEGV
ncbi:hypothetical protein ES705_11738 [subsurface metagenome]